MRRSPRGLVGNHINITYVTLVVNVKIFFVSDGFAQFCFGLRTRSGYWTHRDSGIGGSIDSFYEYLLKAGILFNDEMYHSLFEQSYDVIETQLRRDDWYAAPVCLSFPTFIAVPSLT
jgi:hypothetical protein